jgi:hypothetical protein
MLTLMGIGGCAITVLGDYIQYMNRDIQTWIYIAEVIVGLCVTIVFLFGGILLNR